MQYVTVSTITRDDQVISRSIVGKPTSTIEPQQEQVRRMTGITCMPDEAVESRFWVDSKLRYNESQLTIHCIK